MKSRLPALLLLIALLSSCQSEPNLASAPEISFSNQIQPILAGNCTMSGCHGSSGGEFSLVSYQDVASHVKPGNARNSELYRTVANRTDRLMPPGGPLSDGDISTIYIWIEQGAKNN